MECTWQWRTVQLLLKYLSQYLFPVFTERFLFPEVYYYCCAAVVALQQMYVDLKGAVSSISYLFHPPPHEELVHFLSVQHFTLTKEHILVYFAYLMTPA